MAKTLNCKNTGKNKKMQPFAHIYSDWQKYILAKILNVKNTEWQNTWIAKTAFLSLYSRMLGQEPGRGLQFEGINHNRSD